MAWEPMSHLMNMEGDNVGDEQEEEEEDAVALMGCTGRGRSEHPTFESMVERVPCAAKAQYHGGAIPRNKVGMGRSQVLRERHLDTIVTGERTVGSSRCSSSATSDLDKKSTQSAPLFPDSPHNPDGPPTTSLHSGHGGARKKTRGRGRALPKHKPEPKIEPVTYPFQPATHKTIRLPGAVDTDAEVLKRSMAKAHSWVNSGGITVEFIPSKEKKRIMAQPGRKHDLSAMRLDFDRLLEASGTFSRAQTSSNADQCSLLSTSTKPVSSLDVMCGDESNMSLSSSSNMLNDYVVAGDDGLGDGLSDGLDDGQGDGLDDNAEDDLDDFDNLRSNSAYVSPELSPDLSVDVDESYEEIDDFGRLTYDASAAAQAMGRRYLEDYALEGATAFPIVPDDLYIDIGKEDIDQETLYSLTVPKEFQDVEREKNVMKDQSIGDFLVKDVTESASESSIDDVSVFKHNDDDHQKGSAGKTTSKKGQPKTEVERPGFVMIRNIATCTDSRDLVRDIVANFGIVQSYDEQERSNGTIQVKVCFRQHSSAEMLVNCLHENDSLIQDTILEVEDITSNSYD